MNHELVWRHTVAMAVLAAVYFAAGKIGLSLAIVNPSATAVWPPTGIAIAGLLIISIRAWPAVFVAAFLVNVTTAGTISTSFGIAIGNTLEAVAACYLVERLAGGRKMMSYGASVFRFALFAGLVSTLISPTIGVSVLSFAGFSPWSEFVAVWGTWWLGDVVGALTVAPAILAWSNEPWPRWRPARVAEALVLFFTCVLVSLAVFDDLLPIGPHHYPFEFLCTPFLLWAAFRFGPREAATAIVVVSTIATRGTLSGHGPFAQGDWNESLLLLQAFMGVSAVLTLVLAAEVARRRDLEAELHRLAVTDPLTDLGNYRQFVGVIDAEIARSARTAQSFAVLFIDVDALKAINDRHGHLAGSRALVRVANAIRGLSRSMDTPARYGGDEFALVLPGTSRLDAEKIAARICARLESENEMPKIRISFGVATHPNDGVTSEELIGAADRMLYNMKAARGAPA